jgi:dihydroorotate dehydrogenase (fumarate)
LKRIKDNEILKQISLQLNERRIKDPEKLIKEEWGIDLSSSYLCINLRNPVIIAPGPLSQSVAQVKSAAQTGYGGMVLKSVVGEDKKGNASMKSLRTKPRFAKWVVDAEGNPVYHWNGGLDLRNLDDYLKFISEAYKIGRELDFPIISSFLCHLPMNIKEEWRVDEWYHTVSSILEAANSSNKDNPLILEIDFCPFLKREKIVSGKNIVKRWYKEAPELVKDVSSEIKVIPKVLNLDFGMEFQTEMVKAAQSGKSDGVVIANRFFRKYKDKNTNEEYFTAHGGKELRELNKEQVAKAKEIINIPISATGGTYSGRNVYDYMMLGAQNVQMLTYIMRFGFEHAFRNILLNQENGLVSTILDRGNKNND